jgi:hypothetical protein
MSCLAKIIVLLYMVSTFIVKLIFVGRNMVVVGGTLQNGSVTNEILNFDLDYYEWSRIILKTPFEASS